MFGTTQVRARSDRRGWALAWPLFGVSLAWLTATAATAAAVPPTLPHGGVVQSGVASIGPATGESMVVRQSSGTAIIDWTSFSVGAGAAVTFDNGAGATLNRVTGASAADIDGLLSATGSVYVIDPHGVIIGKRGVVDVGGGFVASALNLTDSQFLAGGDLTFFGAGAAAVVNLGKIGALGGDVALVAAKVANDGEIDAARGSVGVISGYRVLIRDRATDAGKFAVLLGGANTAATNAGVIDAAEVELRANGGNVYALAGNTASLIKATGVAADQGRVFLVAQGGTVVAHGEIDASGAGGKVETSGGAVDFTGLKVRAANWLIDPENLTIDAAAAATLGADLATTNVTLQTNAAGANGPGVVTAGGAGDIVIAAPVAWGSAHTLTLSAYHSIMLDADLTANGQGDLVMHADNHALGSGTVAFSDGAKVSTLGTVAVFYNPTSYKTPTAYAADITARAGLSTFMEVNSLSDLQDIAQNLSGDYALNADVNALATATWNGGAGFRPIGAPSKTFDGALYGEGYTISGLTIDTPTASYVGLFGDVGFGGVISDVKLTSASVTGNSYAGVLAGYSSGLEQFSSVQGQLTAKGSNAGILVGFNYWRIYGCVTSGGISGAGSYIGGMVGTNDGKIRFSSSSATVSGAVRVGGLVGRNYDTITLSSASGAVNGEAVVGGLVGYNYSYVNGSFATGAVSASGDEVGGLAGNNGGNYETSASGNSGDGEIFQSYATGSVKAGGGEAGGLVGYNHAIVRDSYATGAVKAVHDVGGLVGLNGEVSTVPDPYVGLVSDTYSTGAVSGQERIGGLVGQNLGDIARSYATGAPSGGAEVGGLVGWEAAHATIMRSYWDTTTSGVQTGVGVPGYGGLAQGLTSSQFADPSTFPGWRFGAVGSSATWVIADGFPKLMWQFPAAAAAQ